MLVICVINDALAAVVGFFPSKKEKKKYHFILHRTIPFLWCWFVNDLILSCGV